ncbi:hypothetical protein [Gordonia aichiensis]|uniref:Uncharacterized protein n=1 Tax=Gordonia aichiensis NBRC 108223 TaxID=1220583 RepID=L7KQ86_9ACTN|nr:hypothetical protein [Gordonia aichiensis]GAC50990.1 hypothetical protein GOACH_36_00120 [Gordonia aichiensis NBRC 108223]
MKWAMDADQGSRDPELVAAVLAELHALRSERGQIVPEILVNYPALYGLASQTNARDAWIWLRQVSASGATNKFLQAARLTALSEGRDVLSRLTDAGIELDRDQRTIREWSNKGMQALAQLLVDASYLSGARAMHFVDMHFIKIRETEDGEPMPALRIFWAGHQFLEGESVRVYASDPDLGPEQDDYSELGQQLMEVVPTWRQIVPPRGVFTIQTGIEICLPTPLPETLKLITLKFGKQSTQLVRIYNLPVISGKRVSASVFRQGVSFWFGEPPPARRSEFDWGRTQYIKYGDVDEGEELANGSQ